MAEQETEVQRESDTSSDTIWLEDVRYTNLSNPDFSWDTTVLIDDIPCTLHLFSESVSKDYEGISTYIKDGKLHAQKHIGPNSLFQFELYDAQDNIIVQNSWDKYELESYIAVDLLAGSRGDRWAFGGYHEEFGQFLIHTRWMFEDSDVGEEYMLFLDDDLKIKDFFLDSYTGGGACQCGIEPSNDGKTFAFCSRIQRSNGKHTNLLNEGKEIAGSFVLNDEYCLVIEMFEGKPPYKNAKLINNRGVVAKTFDYTGISQALGYIISKFEVKDQDATFLLDHQKRCLFRIDLNNPLKIDRIDIDAMEKMPEGEVLDRSDSTYLEVSSEGKDFYFQYSNGSFRYYGESAGH
ncbi:MAG: hypothetical protein Crog4KO_03100 [Crocinitomicaceae bacterium]